MRPIVSRFPRSGLDANETTANAGAAGGTAVTPVVAISMAFNDTFARINAGPAITVSGDVDIQSNQGNDTTATAEGSTKGSTAVGAAIGMTVAEDHSDASLMRNLTSTAGGLLLLSGGAAATLASSKAGAEGAEDDDTKAETVDSKNNKQLNFSKARAKKGTGKDAKEQSTPKPEAPDKDDKTGTGKGSSLSVAAAISINMHDAVTTSTIGDGLTVNVDGLISVQGMSNFDGAANADGSSATVENGTSVGAALALNKMDVTNEAMVGNATLFSDGLIVDASMAEREISIAPTSTKTVDVTTNTIYVGEKLEDLSAGDEVTYRKGSGDNIGGLTDGTKYFVNSIDEGRIKLAKTADGDAIDLTSLGTGTAHKLERASKTTITFDPNKAQFTIVPDGATALATGDAVVYSHGGGGNVSGLTDGTTYYVIIRDSGNLEFATTYDKALDGEGEEIKSVGTGKEHTITESVHSGTASAISGASGGKTGVAGSLAINVTGGNTKARLKSGASVTLSDGGDSNTTVEDVTVNAIANTNNRVTATPADKSSGSNLGVGLSVAVNVTGHDTTASIDSSANVIDASNVALSASGQHTMLTIAESGAESEKTAVAGSVALGLSNNDTTATVGTGAAALDVDGDLSIIADASQAQKTTADGETGGDGVGVGVSFALGIMEDDSTASLQRNVSTAADVKVGDVTIQSNAVATVETESSASAKGAEDSEDEEDTADKETKRNTNFTKKLGGMSIEDDADVPTSGDRVDDANTKSEAETENPGGKDAGKDDSGNEPTTKTKGGKVKVAAAIGASVLSSDVTASIANGVIIQSSGDVKVQAIGDADAATFATGLAVADGAAGIGAAVSVNVVLIDTSASVGNGTLTAKSLSVEAGTPNDESSDFKLRSVAGGKTQNGTAIAGAVGVNVVTSHVAATIAAAAKVTTTGGPLEVLTRNQVGIQTLVGGAAQSKKATDENAVTGAQSKGNSFGAAVGVNVVSTSSLATIGAGADIKAGSGDVSVNADSAVLPLAIDFPDFPIEKLKELLEEQIEAVQDAFPHVTMVVAGAGDSAGGSGIAGSVAVSVYDITTTANLGDGSKVAAKNVAVEANDELGIMNFVGALARGLTKGGFGAGLDIVIIDDKSTTASVASETAAAAATINASGNVTVEATSEEDIFSLSANVGIGKSTGVAGAVVVVVQDTSTLAFLGPKSVVTAQGSVHVAADSNTSIDAAAGAAAGASGVTPTDSTSGSGGSGGTSVGASVAVVVDDDKTEAFVGSGAKVNALGKGTIAAINVRDGRYDNDGNQGTAAVRGLAVTATSFDDVLTVGIGAAAAAGKTGSSVGIGLSVTVNVLTGDTLAHVDNGATINGTNAGAGTSQSVVMRAADKTILNSDVGGAALSLGTGSSKRSIAIGGAVEVGIVENNVRASMDGATVNALGALILDSHSTSNLDTLAIGVAGAAKGGSGGGLALAGAGSGSGNTVDNTVEAMIRNNSTVDVGGAVTLSATDNSYINTVAGAAALSLSFGSKSKAAAVGVSVAVNDVDNIVRTDIHSSSITSGGKVTLTSDSKPTIKALTVGGAVSASGGGGTGGSLAGAGAASINNIGGSVEAIVRGTSTVVASAFSVTATDKSGITADVVGASLAASGTGGSSGAIAIGVSIARNEIDNKVNAYVEGAKRPNNDRQYWSCRVGRVGD